MRVQWALLTRYAEQRNGLYTMVGAGIDAFYPQGLPTLIQAFLVVQFRFGTEEVGATPELEFVVRDEQTQVVGEPVPVTIDPLRLNANHPPGYQGGIGLCGPFGVPVETAGAYSLNIVVEGALGWDLPFRVAEPGTPHE